MTRERVFAALSTSLLGCALLLTGSMAAAVEHPGWLEQDANCSTCHAQKTVGTSVHSAMSSPCTVCHVTMTRGDMTTVNLSMPKSKICFACHEEAAALKLHNRGTQGQCVECHDAHSSQRRMLLLGKEEGAAALSALKSK